MNRGRSPLLRSRRTCAAIGVASLCAAAGLWLRRGYHAAVTPADRPHVMVGSTAGHKALAHQGHARDAHGREPRAWATSQPPAPRDEGSAPAVDIDGLREMQAIAYEFRAARRNLFFRLPAFVAEVFGRDSEAVSHALALLRDQATLSAVPADGSAREEAIRDRMAIIDLLEAMARESETEAQRTEARDALVVLVLRPAPTARDARLDLNGLALADRVDALTALTRLDSELAVGLLEGLPSPGRRPLAVAVATGLVDLGVPRAEAARRAGLSPPAPSDHATEANADARAKSRRGGA